MESMLRVLTHLFHRKPETEHTLAPVHCCLVCHPDCYLPACEQQSECSSFKKMLVVVCRLHDMNVYGIPPESMEKTLQDAILYYEGK